MEDLKPQEHHVTPVTASTSHETPNRAVKLDAEEIEKIKKYFNESETLVNQLVHNGVPEHQIFQKILDNYYARDRSSEIVGRGKPVYNNEEAAVFLKNAFKGTNLEPKWSEDSGWGLFATKKIPRGALVLSDSPLAAVCIAPNHCSHCGNCLFSFKVSCPKCPYETYCSDKCKNIAYDLYHRSICGSDPKELIESGRRGVSASAKFGYLAYKIIGMALNMFENQTQDTQTEENTKKSVTIFDLPWIKYFCGFDKITTDPRTFEQHMEDVMEAIVPVNPRIKELFDWDDWCALFSVLITNAYGYKIKGNDPYNHTKGSCCAIYGRASFFNHSCVPNTEWDIECGEYKVLSTKRIEKGEQVFISYIDVTGGYKMRKQRLTIYGFKCKCSLCVQKK